MLAAIAATAGCAGSEDAGGAGTTLRWFAQIQPGGTIQDVAERCGEESNGRYNIELELLPTLSDQARSSSFAGLAPRTRPSTSSPWT